MSGPGRPSNTFQIGTLIVDVLISALEEWAPTCALSPTMRAQLAVSLTLEKMTIDFEPTESGVVMSFEPTELPETFRNRKKNAQQKHSGTAQVPLMMTPEQAQFYGASLNAILMILAPTVSDFIKSEMARLLIDGLLWPGYVVERIRALGLRPDLGSSPTPGI